jgi:tetratricopeptide (TPR) repeat protein
MMKDQTFRLNSRLATPEREYLIQTLNDQNQNCVLSSIFAEGELLETQKDVLDRGIDADEILRRVREAHEERTKELEYLIGVYREVAGGDEVDMMVYLGQALLYKKMYDEAANLFMRATTLDPESHRAWVHLGIVQFRLGRWQNASASFLKCVELCPDFADYRNHLGEAYLAMESCRRAVIEFDEAIGRNVYYGDAYLNLALAYILNAIRREDFKLFSSQTEKTDEMLKKAEMIMPDIMDQTYLEGKKFLDEGDLERAFKRLLTCRERRKEQKWQEFANSYMKFMLGANRVNEKLLTRRIKSLKEAIAANPHYADLHHDLAIAYTLLGSFVHTKAVKEYRQALSINPDFDRARRNLKLAENEIKGFEVLVKAIMKD